jgi:ethanolamine ammonia-lyase small subunit
MAATDDLDGAAGSDMAAAAGSVAPESIVANPWRSLQRFTPARIGLGRAGVSLPTAAQLDFQLAHARARDAVHRGLDLQALRGDIEALGLPTLALHSAATSRSVYLQRPDLGRRLGGESRLQLEALRAQRVLDGTRVHHLAFVVADGLSALAVQRHAAPLLAEVLARSAMLGWQTAPVAVVEQGRVAVGDDVGELLDSRIVVVLIGERPGLSSPDSLGIYLTWAPRPGRSDAERNCISNVRPEGLGYAEAAARLVYLLTQAQQRGLTGVALKDESSAVGAVAAAAPNFLLGDT